MDKQLEKFFSIFEAEYEELNDSLSEEDTIENKEEKEESLVIIGTDRRSELEKENDTIDYPEKLKEKKEELFNFNKEAFTSTLSLSNMFSNGKIDSKPKHTHRLGEPNTIDEDELLVADDSEEEDTFGADLILETVKQEEKETGDDFLGLREYYNKRSALNTVKTRQKMTDDVLDSMSLEARKRSKIDGSKEFLDKRTQIITNRVTRNNNILSLGMNRVWRDDSEYQTSIITQILSEDRAIVDWMIPLYIEYFKEVGIFYNPNEDYMIDAFGDSIKNIEYGVYTPSGGCKYARRLMLPLEFLDGSIHGFAGYSSVNTDDKFGKTIKYLYPDKSILKKGYVMFTRREEFEKAINDGYTCVIDGLFDKITLKILDINAVSCCGSAITNFHKFALNQVNTKITIPDNDPAGVSFAEKIKRIYGNNSRVIIQTDTNDIDEYLRTGDRVESFIEVFEEWRNNNFPGDLHLTQRKKRIE